MRAQALMGLGIFVLATTPAIFLAGVNYIGAPVRILPIPPPSSTPCLFS